MWKRVQNVQKLKMAKNEMKRKRLTLWLEREAEAGKRDYCRGREAGGEEEACERNHEPGALRGLAGYSA